MGFLIDSGDLLKLEQFGEFRVVRPSRLCLWKPRLPRVEWAKAHARYDHKKGWESKGSLPAAWNVRVADLTLELRFQDNGQVGFFPEHLTYFPELKDALTASGSGKKVLNLFAYTGMATVFAAQHGAEVTHVEIAKKVIEWAKRNFEINQIPSQAVRIIKEDALEFMRREVRRNNRYDVILADPPSFSRIGDGKNWDLEEILLEITKLAVNLLQEQGTLIFTNHHFETGGQVLANLLHDANERLQIESRELFIPEENSPRKLPAGFFVIARS